LTLAHRRQHRNFHSAPEYQYVHHPHPRPAPSPPLHHRHHQSTAALTMMPSLATTCLPPPARGSSPASLWASQHPNILPPMSISPSKKRQLPQVPPFQRRESGVYPARISAHLYHRHQRIPDAMEMYSDSEITTPRTAYDKMFYPHPARPSSSTGNNLHRQHRGSRPEDTGRRASSLARSMFSPLERETAALISQQTLDEQDSGLESVRFESRNEQARRESIEFIPRRSRRSLLLEQRMYESEGGVGYDRGERDWANRLSQQHRSLDHTTSSRDQVIMREMKEGSETGSAARDVEERIGSSGAASGAGSQVSRRTGYVLSFR